MTQAILGIDVSKSRFDVALLVLNNKVKTKQFANNNNGFSELTSWLNKREVNKLHACMEATGNYGEALATYLFTAGYMVSVVNPAQIKGFAQGELSRIKTDKSDSQLIARFCKAINPKAWEPKPEYIQVFQDLVRRLEALQGMYQQEVNRLDVASIHVKASIARIIESLSEEIKLIKSEICNHISKYEDLRNKKKLLETIPGIGELTIARILAFMGNVEEFRNAKQYAAFVGLNPKQYQSGSSVRGRTRLSKTGDSSLRKAFYMPAIVAKRYNPIIHAFCQRLKRAGKSDMLIIGAAMRKLVHLIYGVLKSGKPFNEALCIAI